MNIHHNIISLHGAPLIYGSFFSKKRFSWGKNFFGQNIYGEVILKGRTNDQIMPSWGRSFINNKCILQQS